MSFQLLIPDLGGSLQNITLGMGEILFVLGANGTGKSSLMQRLNKAHLKNTRWIAAHRQNWFGANSISLSPQQKRDTEKGIRQTDTHLESRWKDPYAGYRPDITIYELVEAENIYARTIAKAFRADDAKQLENLKKIDPPIIVINELLKASNLPLEISFHENEQVVASKSGSEVYSIAQLSDGERNALLIAANVLTAPPGTLLLLDEPERHLHRSIISPLLTQLFKKRSDCVFVVSTHDVLLPLDNPEARTLLIRACKYNGVEVGGWEANLVPSDNEIDESLKFDVLGSRKKILFVEGTGRSLDQPLYSLLFPEVSVIAKSSCRDVEHAVTGVRGAANLHWLHAFGIVDSDAQPPDEIEKLKLRGIYAVPAYSVESLYYHPEIQLRIAKRHAEVTGDNPHTQLAEAKSAAMSEIKSHADRMSRKVAEKSIRTEIFMRIPGKDEVKAEQPFNLAIDITSVVAEERARLDTAVAASDLEALIARYPIRETPALSKIASHLGFRNCCQYQAAVQKLLIDDKTAVTFLRSLFGTMWQDITKA